METETSPSPVSTQQEAVDPLAVPEESPEISTTSVEGEKSTAESTLKEPKPAVVVEKNPLASNDGPMADPVAKPSTSSNDPAKDEVCSKESSSELSESLPTSTSSPGGDPTLSSRKESRPEGNVDPSANGVVIEERPEPGKGVKESEEGCEKNPNTAAMDDSGRLSGRREQTSEKSSSSASDGQTSEESQAAANSKGVKEQREGTVLECRESAAVPPEPDPGPPVAEESKSAEGCKTLQAIDTANSNSSKVEHHSLMQASQNAVAAVESSPREDKTSDNSDSSRTMGSLNTGAPSRPDYHQPQQQQPPVSARNPLQFTEVANDEVELKVDGGHLLDRVIKLSLLKGLQDSGKRLAKSSLIISGAGASVGEGANGEATLATTSSLSKAKSAAAGLRLMEEHKTTPPALVANGGVGGSGDGAQVPVKEPASSTKEVADSPQQTPSGGRIRHSSETTVSSSPSGELDGGVRSSSSNSSLDFREEERSGPTQEVASPASSSLEASSSRSSGSGRDSSVAPNSNDGHLPVKARKPQYYASIPDFSKQQFASSTSTSSSSSSSSSVPTSTTTATKSLTQLHMKTPDFSCLASGTASSVPSSQTSPSSTTTNSTTSTAASMNVRTTSELKISNPDFTKGFAAQHAHYGAHGNYPPTSSYEQQQQPGNSSSPYVSQDTFSKLIKERNYIADLQLKNPPPSQGPPEGPVVVKGASSQNEYPPSSRGVVVDTTSSSSSSSSSAAGSGASSYGHAPQTSNNQYRRSTSGTENGVEQEPKAHVIHKSVAPLPPPPASSQPIGGHHAPKTWNPPEFSSKHFTQVPPAASHNRPSSGANGSGPSSTSPSSRDPSPAPSSSSPHQPPYGSAGGLVNYAGKAPHAGPTSVVGTERIIVNNVRTYYPEASVPPSAASAPNASAHAHPASPYTSLPKVKDPEFRLDHNKEQLLLQEGTIVTVKQPYPNHTTGRGPIPGPHAPSNPPPPSATRSPSAERREAQMMQNSQDILYRDYKQHKKPTSSSTKTDAYLSANYRAVGGPLTTPAYQYPPSRSGPMPQGAYEGSSSSAGSGSSVASASSKSVYYPPAGPEYGRPGGKTGSGSIVTGQAAPLPAGASNSRSNPPSHGGAMAGQASGASQPRMDDPRIEDRKFVESMLKKKTSPSSDVMADLQAGKFPTRIPQGLVPKKRAAAAAAAAAAAEAALTKQGPVPSGIAPDAPMGVPQYPPSVHPSYGPAQHHRGADQSVISKLRTSLEQKEYEKQRINQLRKQPPGVEQPTEEDRSQKTSIASASPVAASIVPPMHEIPSPSSRFRTKGELKGYTPLPTPSVVSMPPARSIDDPAQLKKDGQEGAGGEETSDDKKRSIVPPADLDGASALDILDWGSACNEFVEQLQTGKKRGRRKRAAGTTASAASTSGRGWPAIDSLEPTDPLAEGASTDLSAIPKEVLNSARSPHRLKGDRNGSESSSDEDKPLLLLRQQSQQQKEQDGKGPVQPEKVARNHRERQRLELEQKHEAKLGRSSSTDSETARVASAAAQRAKARVRKLRHRSSVAPTLSLKSSDGDGDVTADGGEEDGCKPGSKRRPHALAPNAKRKRTRGPGSRSPSSSAASSSYGESSEPGTKKKSGNEGPKKRGRPKGTRTPGSKRGQQSSNSRCQSGAIKQEPNENSDLSSDDEPRAVRTPHKNGSSAANNDSARKRGDATGGGGGGGAGGPSGGGGNAGGKAQHGHKVNESSACNGGQKDKSAGAKKKFVKTRTNSRSKAELSSDSSPSSSGSSSSEEEEEEEEEAEETMTRSRSKREAERRRSNSKVLRNDKIVENCPNPGQNQRAAGTRNRVDSERTPSKKAKKERKLSAGEPTTKRSKSRVVESDSDGGKAAESSAAELYEYKRSLKVPPELITIDGGLYMHRISTSLPDLDSPHHSDGSETFSEIVKKLSQPVYCRCLAAQAAKPTVSSSSGRGKGAKGAGKGANSNNTSSSESTKPKQEYELLPTPGAESESLFSKNSKKKKSLFDTAILKSRTRTEQKAMQSKEMIREVFGGDGERPQSAPPLSCDPEPPPLFEEGLQNVTYDEKYNELMRNVDRIVGELDGGAVAAATTPTPATDETHISKEIRSWVLNKGVGESVMHKAARLGYTDVIVYCLERLDMDPDLKDNAGYTPLHEACAKGHLDIANYLLQYGASHSEPAPSGMRPLHEAVENSFVEIVRLLLAFGADPMLATYAGMTPIQLAESDDMTLF
uniref:Uncharacterized protein n=1 Tax=Anopheles coluzzii TaxID=1518534 RepID=A0A8W7P573_ANOCL